MEKEATPLNLAKAKLALQLIPIVSRQEVFALKGGAAINFFLRDTPRLSVDLDLCYLPLQPRKESLEQIASSMNKIAADFCRAYPEPEVSFKNKSELGTPGTLLLRSRDVDIKIEPNFVLRGNFLPVLKLDAKDSVRKLVAEPPSIQTLAAEEVYAGKICAALDRQLPRDFFDIKYLFESGGVTPQLKDAFIVYLLYQGRPFEEILNPHRLSFKKAGVENLEELSLKKVSFEELTVLRETLIEKVNSSLTDKDKEFLISIMSETPKFDLAPFPDLEKLPGVQWKLLNVKKMEAKKRSQAINKLEKCFERGIERDRQ